MAIGADRAALPKNTKWARGDVITVSFLDGDPGGQQKVRDVAGGWTAPGLANVEFSFRNDTNTLIRVSFTSDVLKRLLQTLGMPRTSIENLVRKLRAGHAGTAESSAPVSSSP